MHVAYVWVGMSLQLHDLQLPCFPAGCAAQSHMLPVGHSPQSTFPPDPKSVYHLLCNSLKLPCPPMEQVLPLPYCSLLLQVSGAIYSGSTGYQIGHRDSLGVDGDGGALLHVTRTGAHYILLPCGMLDATFLGWAFFLE